MVGGSHHCCSLFAWTSRWHNLFYVIISWHHSSWLCLSSVGIIITSLPSSSLTSALLLGYSITLCSNWSQCWSNNKTLKILHFFVTQIANVWHWLAVLDIIHWTISTKPTSRNCHLIVEYPLLPTNDYLILPNLTCLYLDYYFSTYK